MKSENDVPPKNLQFSEVPVINYYSLSFAEKWENLPHHYQWGQSRP